MIASKKIASSVVLFGLFWICVFGEWHTINAFGDDEYIYLVDFDETAYDLYIQGYYPSDYTYADFRRDSIEGMVSHYVATDNNNFSAVVDTIENDVIIEGWSCITDFFENAWIDLKSGVVTVEEGFTDDFKHTLDGRFKTTPVVSEIQINGHTWVSLPCSWYSRYTYNALYIAQDNRVNQHTSDVWITRASNYAVICTFVPYVSGQWYVFESGGYVSKFNNSYDYNGVTVLWGQGSSNSYPYGLASQYNDLYEARNDFYGYYNIHTGGDPYWNGTGYYSDTPTDYSINLPALNVINWPSISNNNKTKYGVDFPDINVSLEFTLPDRYYPQTVVYDVPYWLYNTDSTPVDWVNVSFDDVTLPEVQLSDGDGSFFQALFNTLPLAFVPILLGVILCYLIFLML